MLKGKTILVMGILTFFLGLLGMNSCKSEIDLTNVYPYIIPEGYLMEGLKEETIIADTFDKGIYVSLVYDLNGVVQNVKKSDLEKAGIEINYAYDIALIHLESVMKAHKITMTQFVGPEGIPFILFSDHWLSAASLVNPNLYSFAKKHLKTDVIYASIPHRDVLILFPDCTDEQVNKFREIIKSKESDGRKPLTFNLFKLTKEKIISVD
jgi:uncharacterized protein YtpQ (UPF0354 family)